jgi:hypothetical protein
VADLGWSVNHTQPLIRSCLQNLCFLYFALTGEGAAARQHPPPPFGTPMIGTVTTPCTRQTRTWFDTWQTKLALLSTPKPHIQQVPGAVSLSSRGAERQLWAANFYSPPPRTPATSVTVPRAFLGRCSKRLASCFGTPLKFHLGLNPRSLSLTWPRGLRRPYVRFSYFPQDAGPVFWFFSLSEMGMRTSVISVTVSMASHSYRLITYFSTLTHCIH